VLLGQKVERKASLFDDPLLKMQGCLGKIGGAAEVAPVVFVGAEGEDFLALGGETEIDINDGEGAFLVEHVEEARGNDVNAREGKRKWRLANGEGRVGRQSRCLHVLGMTLQWHGRCCLIVFRLG